MTSAAETITDRFVTDLNTGNVPWETPWTSGRPYNFASGRPYSGVNILTLGLGRFGDPRFGTFKQIRDAGGTVRRGEHGLPIVFYSPVEDHDEDGEIRQRFLVRYTTAFSVTQCDGLELPGLVVPDVRSVMDFPSLNIQFGPEPGYSPFLDVITMPPLATLESTDDYWNNLFPLAVQATAHPSRCARLEDGVLSDFYTVEAYSKEHLVSEIACSMLRLEYGIETPENYDRSVTYLQSWASRLNGDHTLILSAARKADQAVAFLTGASEES